MDSSQGILCAEPNLSCSYRVHKSEVNHVKFSPDGNNLITCSNDHQVIFWELTDGIEVRRSYRLLGHKDYVHAVDYSPSNDYFISCSRDKTACLWRIQRQENKPAQEPVVYNCHCNTIRSVSISPKGDYFCTGSDDKSVKVWSPLCRNKQLFLLRGHTNWIRCAKYCPSDGQLIASCGDDSCLIIHDLRVYDGLPNKRVVKRGIKFTHLDWYPSNKNLLAISSHDACVRIFDLRSDKTLQYYSVHEGSVNHVEFHPSGNYLISSSDDCTSKIFDILEGRVLFTLKEHQSPVNCSSFTQDGKLFATVGKDSIVSLWTSNLLTESDGLTKGSDDIFTKDSSKADISARSAGSHADDIFDMKSSRNAYSRRNSEGADNDAAQRRSSNDPSLLIQILRQLDLMTESLTTLEKRVSLLEDRVIINASY